MTPPVDNVVKFPDLTTGDSEGSNLKALLQIEPELAISVDDDKGARGVNVIMVGQGDEFLSRARDYQERYAAAVAEWDAWDDTSKEYGEEHNAKLDELRDKYDLGSTCLFNETRFMIVDVEK
jgi:hypothetical protein